MVDALEAATLEAERMHWHVVEVPVAELRALLDRVRDLEAAMDAGRRSPPALMVPHEKRAKWRDEVLRTGVLHTGRASALAVLDALDAADRLFAARAAEPVDVTLAEAAAVGVRAALAGVARGGEDVGNGGGDGEPV